MTKFDANKIYTTPKGTLIWCFFHEPTAFGKPEEGASPEAIKHWEENAKYYYETRMTFTGEAANKMRMMCEVAEPAIMAKFGKEQSAYPLFKEIDEDGEKGIEVKFRIKPEGFNPKNGNRWSNQPKYLNGEGLPFEKGVVPIGNGTVAQIGFKFEGYPGLGGGVSMRPKAVFIHEYIEYTPQEQKKSSEEYWADQAKAGLDEELPF